MTAAERLKALLAELLEQLRLSGCAETNSCARPLTQEILTDATGLTSVYLNRMLQSARRENRLLLSHNVLELRDPDRFQRQVRRMRRP